MPPEWINNSYTLMYLNNFFFQAFVICALQLQLQNSVFQTQVKSKSIVLSSVE